MSYFYGEMQGNKGSVTRGGNKVSGIWCHLRGWNSGIKVSLQNDNGKDIIIVSKTGGSNSPNETKIVYREG